MARGKPVPPEKVYEIMAAWAVSQNCAEVSRAVDLPYRTVWQTIQQNKDREEYKELQNQKKEEFADKASVIIDKGLLLLERRLSTALEREEELDALLSEIAAAPNEDIPQPTKAALIAKIRALEVQKLGEITTAIGTLYDKRALARGETTVNSGIVVEFGIPRPGG